MNEQLFQTLLIVFSGIMTLVAIIVGFAVRSFLTRYKEDRETNTTRLNSHSDTLKDHQQRITRNEEQLSANNKADEARMDFMKITYGHIEKGIDELKGALKEVKTDSKTLENRVTDYLLNGKKTA